MSTLSDELKTFIVQQLACFDTPSEVARAVKDEFAVEVTRQSVERYDPNKRAGSDLSEAYRAIFIETRKAFLEDTAAIGIANRSVRLRKLQTMFDSAIGSRNLVLAASLLEQAAKESGGAFTNKRELGGLGGGAIKVEDTTKPDLRALGQEGRDALRTVIGKLAGGSEGDAEGA